jgi:hypothetical protein
MRWQLRGASVSGAAAQACPDRKVCALRWSKSASGRVIKDGTHLLKRNARKPFYELCDESTVLEVLE